jgi:hypothetical protein
MHLTEDMIDELEQLEHKHGDLQTSIVLAKAKDPNSALHKYPGYKWDVTEAAEAHWLYITRKMIQVYVEVIQEPNQKPVSMRGYVSIVDDLSGERVYRRTTRVLKQDRSLIIHQVCDRCENIVQSYHVRELDPILKAIVEIRAALKKTTPKKRKKKPSGKGRSAGLSV